MDDHIENGLEVTYSTALTDLKLDTPNWDELNAKYNPQKSCSDDTISSFSLVKQNIMVKFSNCTNDALDETLKISAKLENDFVLIKKQCQTYQVFIT